jgi:hypothetical protein
VRQALESASPPERKPRQGVAWRLDPFKAAIDAMQELAGYFRSYTWQVTEHRRVGIEDFLERRSG